MSVCTCIAQDCAHLTQVLSHRPIVHCLSEHWLLFRAPLWEVALSLAMADDASSAEDSLDDNSNLGCTEHSYRTQEVQLKPDWGTEGRMSGSWRTSAYSFLYYFFILYIHIYLPYTSLFLLVLIFQIHKLLIEVRGMCLCVCLVLFNTCIGRKV